MLDYDSAAFDARVVDQDIGIDVIKIVPIRQSGIACALHGWSILTDVIGDICYRKPGLEQDRAAADVIDERPGLFEPGIVSVESGAKPLNNPRHLLFRLVDINVQNEVVDSCAIYPVAPTLD